MSKYPTSKSSARDSLALAISLGVWISIQSRSTHHWRIACSKVVWTRKMRFAPGLRKSRKRQSMRLSTLESSAMGGSGSAAPVTTIQAILTSRPPSLTRSSILSSPVTSINEPEARAEMASVSDRRSGLEPASGSSSRSAGFTSCAAPDSSRRMTNWTFF